MKSWNAHEANKLARSKLENILTFFIEHSSFLIHNAKFYTMTKCRDDAKLDYI